MSASTLRSITSGAFFGAALTAAGVYSPTVIIDQLKLTNYHMLTTFISASASSAIAIILAQKFGFTTCKPRLPNTLNWFSPYDGNIIGGLLLGFGLALTGACPGTVLPQVVTGVRSGPLVLAGGLLGGILYSKYGKQLQRKVEAKNVLEKPTMYQNLGVGKTGGIVVYEGICLGAIAVFGHFFPEKGELLVPAAVGGILIGGSQAASLVLTGNTLGISTAYEQIGDLFWWAEESVVDPGDRKPIPSIKGNAFAVGTMVGSYAVSRLVEIPRSETVEVGAVKAVVGGAVMLFGSRIAGGCTSGHGISGMSQLSISSIISVAAMFGGGILLSAFL